MNINHTHPPRPSALRLLAVALVAAPLLAGCGSLVGPKLAVKTYSPQTQVHADAAWPQAAWSLGVGVHAGVELLDSPRIAVRPTPDELQTYKGAAWADTAPEMLQTALIVGFEDSGKIAAVTRLAGASSSHRNDLGLVLEVRAFEGDYASGAPEAVIEVQARLFDARSGQSATRRFRQSVPGASPEIPAMVAAFGDAMSALNTQVVGWTLVEGNRLRATAPAPAR